MPPNNVNGPKFFTPDGVSNPTLSSPELQANTLGTVGVGLPNETKMPHKKLLTFIALIVFGLSVAVGYFGYSTLDSGTDSDFRTYAGDATFDFIYPEDWLISEENTLEKQYGSHKIIIKTSDYTTKELEGRIGTVTTSGYSFEISQLKNDEYTQTGDEMYDDLAKQISGVKKIQLRQDTHAVQIVGMPSVIKAYAYNSSTTTYFEKNGYNYWLTYNYPQRDDFEADSRYMPDYTRFLNSFMVE